jgi:transcriptional regulator with PAS, ATPase and Fis domain
MRWGTLETQIALLQARFEQIGGTRSIHTDVRVITATGRDLQAAIATGVFRSDLFYRLNVFPIKFLLCVIAEKTFPCWSNIIDRFARKARKSIRGMQKPGTCFVRIPGPVRRASEREIGHRL